MISPEANATPAGARSDDEALRLIVEGTSGATGAEFFNSLVRHLARALDFRYALVGELVPGGGETIRTLAVWTAEGFGDNFRYALAGTPCAGVVGRSLCRYPRDVWRSFPDDALLAEQRIESYLGAPLFDSAGAPLGILVVMDDRPRDGVHAPHAEHILRIFAARAASELERKRSDEALREAYGQLEHRVEERTAELSAANEALRREVAVRRAAEDRLRESEQRYASILNTQQTLVARSDANGRITYVNAAHRRTFGSNVGDAVFLRVHPDDQPATARAMEALQRPPFNCTLEQRVEVKGEWRTFLWQCGVIRGRDGRIAEVQGVGFDITDRRRAEEGLRDGERRAREAAERNRRLVMEVDHRVRNNLAGLLGLVREMRKKPAGAQDVQAFADAIEGRLVAMVHVHQILAEAHWRAVDLKSLVSTLLAAVQKLGCHPVPVRVDGPPVALGARQALPLAMILIEWFTNSCKHGAHSVAAGRLEVTWEPLGPRDVRLRWKESGGPPVKGPVTASLGTELVKSFARGELRGHCTLRFPESGADHLLEFPKE